jgi:Zn-finger nucleic acid-binding protein
MKCLNCGAEMMNHFVETKKQKISYDICEKCGSLWLDKGELDKLAFQVDGSIEYCSRDQIPGKGQNVKACPRCDGVTLENVAFVGNSDIPLDRCPNCEGFWLDGGELNLADRYLEKIMPVSGHGFTDFVNNVHVPYWHKRVRKDSSETDFKEAVPPVKGATLKGKTPYKCPVCNATMNAYDVFHIAVEACPGCRGMFLDRNELRKLKDKAKKDTWQNLRWMDDEIETIEKANLTASARKCPKCQGQRLLTTNFGESSVLIDYCPSCHGIWLDNNEFQEIIEYLKAELLKLSSDEMKKKLYKEIKEIWNGPETVWSEVVDAKAAILAFLSLKMYEHPVLSKRLLDFGSAAGKNAKSIGLG